MFDLIREGGVLQELKLGAVALVVGLAHDEESIFVAQLVKARRVWIVSGAHRVDVVLLHQPQVGFHVIEVDGRAGDRVGVVAVDAAQLDRLPIDVDDGIHDRDLTDADAVGDDLLR